MFATLSAKRSFVLPNCQSSLPIAASKPKALDSSGVPADLRAGGAVVYTASVSQSNSTEVRGEQLLKELQTLKARYGHAKFNLVGHSHGGNVERNRTKADGWARCARPSLAAAWLVEIVPPFLIYCSIFRAAVSTGFCTTGDAAVIGVGGRGAGNLAEVGRTENIVALCDVSDASLDSARAKFPAARRYSDFRKLYDAEKQVDAAVFSREAKDLGSKSVHVAPAIIVAAREGVARRD